MHPNKIDIEQARVFNEFICRIDIDANLGNLAQEDIAGVNINRHFCAFEFLNQFACNPLRRRSVGTSRENPVHIQIKTGKSSLDRIDAHRVQCRIDIQHPFKVLTLFTNDFIKQITNVLSFKLIAVNSGNDAKSFKAFC